MIGRSLSFCIKDILEGKKKLSQVDSIVTSTMFESDDEFENGIDSYARVYWNRNPEKGKSIARQLWHSGKIIQPRLNDPSFCQDLRGMKIWVKSMSECEYYPE